MKKILSVTMILVLMMTPATGTAFAAEGPIAGKIEGGNTVPVYLNAAAMGDGAGVDFTITNGITITASASSTVLTIDDLVITNNAQKGQLRVDSLKAAAAEGWTIKEDSETYFAENAANRKEFSLVYDNHDFAVNAEKTLNDSNLIAAGSNLTFDFEGHIGTFTSPVNNAKVAEIVATVSVY